MAQRKPKPERRDWYRVSLDTVRGWVLFLVFVALGVGGVFGFRALQHLTLHRQAEIVIDETQLMLRRVQTSGGVEGYWAEYDESWKILQRARSQLAEGSYAEALSNAKWSRTVLASILDAQRSRGPAGDAHFVAVRGGVEFRRRNGPWQSARNRIVLRSGDYVKTTDSGSAHILFADGTLFKVRPNTVILVSRTPSDESEDSEAIALEYGWVDLNTTRRPSKVSTPRAEARVARRSAAMVAYDEHEEVARFAVYSGAVEVKTEGGTSRRLGAMEQVSQAGGQLTDTRVLPPAPETIQPIDDLELDLASAERLVLSWTRVPGAVRYALQVSRDQHFVDNVIDVEDRTGTSATLGVQGEGTFLWRVAAYGRDGLKGPWCEPRRFRVAAEPAAMRVGAS